jgi:hypothetical protein
MELTPQDAKAAVEFLLSVVDREGGFCSTRGLEGFRWVKTQFETGRVGEGLSALSGIIFNVKQVIENVEGSFVRKFGQYLTDQNWTNLISKIDKQVVLECIGSEFCRDERYDIDTEEFFTLLIDILSETNS